LFLSRGSIIVTPPHQVAQRSQVRNPTGDGFGSFGSSPSLCCLTSLARLVGVGETETQRLFFLLRFLCSSCCSAYSADYFYLWQQLH